MFFKVTDGVDICYIEMNLNKDPKQGIIEVRIQDISKIVKMQQSLSDKIYQSALEANYSHEQMTPLNCILSNSKILTKWAEQGIL